MPNNKISIRQLRSLLFAALLSPMILILPQESAADAGRGAWLTALPALPVVLLLCWAVPAALRRLPDGSGLGQGLEYAFGKWLGRGITAVYLLWGILLLGWNTHWCAVRFLSTSYRNTPLPFFVVTLLGVTLWVGRGKLAVFARAGEVFALALGVALGISLLFGALQIEWQNLAPVWVEDVTGIVQGSAPVMGVLGYGVFAAFISGYVEPGQGKRNGLLWGGGAFCLILTLFQFVCVGSFGPGLVSRMETPFFMMVKGIGVQGAFERAESFIIALWVLADLALLGLLFFACREMVKGWTNGKREKGIAWMIALGAGIVAIGMMSESYTIPPIMERLVTIGNIVLGAIVPLLAALVIGVFRKYGKEEKKR